MDYRSSYYLIDYIPHQTKIILKHKSPNSISEINIGDTLTWSGFDVSGHNGTESVTVRKVLLTTDVHCLCKDTVEILTHPAKNLRYCRGNPIVYVIKNQTIEEPFQSSNKCVDGLSDANIEDILKNVNESTENINDMVQAITKNLNSKNDNSGILKDLNIISTCNVDNKNAIMEQLKQCIPDTSSNFNAFNEAGVAKMQECLHKVANSISAANFANKQPNTTNVGTVNITTPNVTTPNVTTPNVTTPHVTTPNVTTPNVTTPNVTTPNVTTPNVTTPNVTTPNVSISNVVNRPTNVSNRSVNVVTQPLANVVTQPLANVVNQPLAPPVIATPKPEDPGYFAGFNMDIVNAHNEARSAHGSPSLQFDPELAKNSQKHAEYLASICSMEHSTQKTITLSNGNVIKFGENLYGSGSNNILPDIPNDAAALKATKSWYSEICDYKSGAAFSDIGHYTQLLWTDTTHIGAGYAKCPYKKNGLYWYYVVAQYNPPGNYTNYKLSDGTYSSEMVPTLTKPIAFGTIC